MSDRSRRVCREVAARHAELQELLDQIRELLDDIAEAEADASWYQPAVPVDGVPDRLEDVARKIRQLFELEEDERYLAALSRSRPELRDSFERLNAEHPAILERLEELYELAGSSVCPTSTWDDVESHFLGFERRLSCHRKDELQLLSQAGWPES
jgi:Zn-dependent oligopeptidase